MRQTTDARGTNVQSQPDSGPHQMKITKAFSKFHTATGRAVRKPHGPKSMLLANHRSPFIDGVVRLTDVTGLTGIRVTAHNRRKLRRTYGLRQANHKGPMRVTRRRPGTA